MTKVVVNKCYGGFSLSDQAVSEYARKKGIQIYPRESSYGSTLFYTAEEGGEYFSNRPHDRSDPHLVAVVEEMGESANGMCAELEIVEIPDDVEWEIEEYDGNEWIAEKHRTW